MTTLLLCILSIQLAEKDLEMIGIDNEKEIERLKSITFLRRRRRRRKSCGWHFLVRCRSGDRRLLLGFSILLLQRPDLFVVGRPLGNDSFGGLQLRLLGEGIVAQINGLGLGLACI